MAICVQQGCGHPLMDHERDISLFLVKIIPLSWNDARIIVYLPL